MKAQQKNIGKPTEASRRRLSQIYEVAAQLFCDKGFDATSMSDIAEAVGITKAGIYHFVPGGKKDLLFGVMNYGMDQLEESVIAPARPITDAEKRLRSIITNHARLITGSSGPDGHSPVTIVVDEIAGLAPAQLRKINQRKRAYLDLVRGTLQQLKDEGKLKDVDLTVAAFSLIGMMLWLSRWFQPGGRLTSEQVADEIAKIALGGLLRPQARLAGGR
ncbi:MAG: TetR family transcriptional regulator, partial [Blastocatellia bacterium]|nr:TetR family transcriptional regulator [Blastocatellia bacterium]